MNWLPSLIRLRDLLAQIYLSKEGTFRLVDAANISKGNIAFDDAAVSNWHNILTEAISRGKFSALVEVCIQDSGSAQLKNAYHDYINEMQQTDPPADIVRDVIEWKPVVGLSILSCLLLLLLILLYLGVIGRGPKGSVRETSGQTVTPRGQLLINFVDPEQSEQDDWVKRFYQLQNYECNDQMVGDPAIKCAPVAIESTLQNDADKFRWVISHPMYGISGRAYMVTADGLIAPLEFRSSDTFVEFAVPNARKGDKLVAILRLSCRCEISVAIIRASLQSNAN